MTTTKTAEETAAGIGHNSSSEEASEIVADTVKKGTTIEQAIVLWSKATANAKALARFISEEALKHFKEHNNTAKLQLFLDAMERHGKNYVRVAAYKKWMLVHAPITMLDGRLVVDKSREWDEEVYLKAFIEPYWDFAPDPENVDFGATDVINTAIASLKKFDKDNYIAKDDAATAKVAAVRSALEALG